MTLKSTITAVLGTVALAAGAAYAPVASADRGVGFNISIGGPGYALSVGDGGYGYGYYDSWRPAPVVVAPYAPYYRPYRSHYRHYAPVIVQPYPVYRSHNRHRYDRHDRHDRQRHDGWRRHDRPAGYVHYGR